MLYGICVVPENRQITIYDRVDLAISTNEFITGQYSQCRLNGIALFITGWLTTLSKEHGVIAIRSMSFVAGGCLLVGVVVYFIIKRGASPPPPVTES